MNFQTARDLFDRVMLYTSRVSVDAALKESTALVARLKKTQDALRARAARRLAAADRHAWRAAEDHANADRAARIVDKLEEIFG